VLIFIHIPKTDVPPVEYGVFPSLTKTHGRGIVKCKITGKSKAMQHYTWLEIKNHLGEDVFNQFTKFSIVRNPYTRIVSDYHWQIKLLALIKPMSFDEFLDLADKIVSRNKYDGSVHEDHFMPQYMYLYDEDMTLQVEHVFKLEEIVKIKQFLWNNYKKKIGHHKKYNKRKSQIVLNDAQKERVYLLYKKDFELFGYDR
jgi:hypothetical protein